MRIQTNINRNHYKGKWEQSLHKAAVAARPYVSAESRSTVTLDATLDRNRERFPDPIHFYLGQGKHRLALARV